MPMSRMPRLLALLSAESGEEIPAEAAFEVDFAFDRQGLVKIDLKVRAGLPLICQRSLQSFTEQVDRRSLLTVIENVEDQETVPAHYEPFLVEDKRLRLAELVEEELLLAVPQVPRSPDAEHLEIPGDTAVEVSTSKHKEPTHRPFEELAGLLGEQTED